MTPQRAAFIFWRNIVLGIFPIGVAVVSDGPLLLEIGCWITGALAILSAFGHAVIYHRVRRHWEDHRPR